MEGGGDPERGQRADFRGTVYAQKVSIGVDYAARGDMISKRERKEAIIWCNIRACWEFNNSNDDFYYALRNRMPCLAYRALAAVGVDLTGPNTLGQSWLEAEALLRDGWSPE
jgi:hypothetical protein